jgi:predicted secreted hydrolase
MRRRAFLALPMLLAAPRAGAVAYPPVVAGVPLDFPRDHGAHPAYRIEWWYATGWLADRAGGEYGFQITFFRNRPGVAEAGESAFAARQLVFAHAALADPRRGRLLHDQRSAREGFGLAGAAEARTRAWIDDWSFAAAGDGYAAKIAGREFTLELALAATQPILPQGERGYSRKGPRPEQASHYYSRPHLAVSGTIAFAGAPIPVTGSAWLDHEWSSEILAAGGVGWDWTGINLDDGAALMAFRIRERDGRALWAGGTLRAASGASRSFPADAVAFTAQRTWRSPRTGIDYPVAMTVDAGGVEYLLSPLLDDQELDSRASTGTIYWEGAVKAAVAGREVGRGYLELTGYGQPLRL